MEKEKFSYPVSLRRMQITDKFWKNEMELVRTEVIPYQWNALNDKVEGAAPSYCMHNFKVAAEMNRQKRKQGAAYKEPSYTYRGFEMLPEDPENLKDEFYGFFQVGGSGRIFADAASRSGSGKGCRCCN